MARKKPCTICRRWFLPDPRVGRRQRACSAGRCRGELRRRTQAAWRARHPDYFVARRMQARGSRERVAEPLRVGGPLARLPWDIAQDEFGVQGADFIGVMGKVILGAVQDEMRAQVVDSG